MVPRSERLLFVASMDQVAARLLRRPSSPRVHSVFERAINLTTADGELLALVGPRAGNGPASLVLATSELPSLNRLGIEPGMSARTDGTRLRIGTALEVEFGPARLWRPARSTLRLGPRVALERLTRAEATAAAAAPGGGLSSLLPTLPALAGELRRSEPDDPICRAAARHLAGVVAAWTAKVLSDVCRHAAGLAGLGPGLTPSGDDALAGFLVAARRAGLDWPAARRACVETARGRTTDIALARIRHAAADRIEEIQEDALEALLGEADVDLERAVARAARWGHTSGVDTLVGVFAGLRVAVGFDSGSPLAGRGGASHP